MSEVIWHDVECGAYAADLELWSNLANKRDTVLDIGAGTGRVSLALAAQGARVTALDTSAELLAELRRRARGRALAIETVQADARDFDLDRDFDLIIAPMQLVQLLGGQRARRDFLHCAVRHLGGHATLAIVIMNVAGEPLDDQYEPPMPDMREQDGCVYSSQPTAIRLLDRGREIALDRVRIAVSPSGETQVENNTIKLRLVTPERLESEARAVGLEPASRRKIAATDDHVGSDVLLFERR